MQQVFGQPMDSILFEVIEAMPLQTPIVFNHFKPSTGRTTTGIKAYKMPIRSQVFYPLVPGDADLTMASGEHADQVLAEWGCPHGCQDLLAQMQPNPIGPLLIANAFSHTLVLARSPLVVRIFPGLDVPPTQWLDATKPFHWRVSCFKVIEMLLTSVFDYIQADICNRKQKGDHREH